MESQPQNPEFRNNPQNFHPCTSLPASHTPSSLDPEAVHSFNRDVGEFYLFLSCVAVFTQGKLQSPKKIYTLVMEEKEEECLVHSLDLSEIWYRLILLVQI